MKVNGQLENAQFEQKAGAPTPTPTGRIYMDITAPLAAVPWVYNGSAWKQLAFVTPTTLVSQNSGTAVTVDWSAGTYQRVILTGHAVISFSNPQEGLTHTLIVQQAQTGLVQFGYTLDMPGQDASRFNATLQGSTTFGTLQPDVFLPVRGQRTHQWLYKSAFKAAYGTVPAGVISPVNYLPITAALSCDISNDGSFLYLCRSTTPFHNMWNLNKCAAVGQLTMGPINAAFGTAVAIAATGTCVKISPAGNAVAFGSGTSPFLQVMSLGADRTPIVSLWANPATLPAAATFGGVDWHPSGNFIGCGFNASPFIGVYPTPSNGFGAKIADPASLPAGLVTSLAFSPHGDYVAAAMSVTPFISVWAFNAATAAFGAKSANPSTLPVAGPTNQIGKTIAWRPQADFIAMTTSATTPFIYIVPFNRTTGVFGAPLTISVAATPPGTCAGLNWTPDGQYLIVSCGTTPFVLVYDFSGLIVGAPCGYDGTLPINSTQIAIHPSGEYLFSATAASPFVQQIPLPNVAKSYIKLQ